MMFAPWSILLFVLLALGGIIGVAAVPVGVPSGVVIDSRTGEPRPTVSYELEQIRLLGDARVALVRLRELAELHPLAGGIRHGISVLEEELETQSFADVTSHVERLLAADVEPGELNRLLVLLAGSEGEARRTEGWFRGVSSTDGTGPDALADRALRGMLTGRPPPVAEIVAVADAFARSGRLRGQLRWLLRAHRHCPGEPGVSARLAALYVANGRLHEAFAVTTIDARRPSADRQFWERRAELARWLSRADSEADALEQLVERNPDDGTTRRRLIELYVYLGNPERGLPHARALALRAGEIAETEEAADAALASGLADEAMAMLDRIAEQVDDPTPWRLRVVDLALQDLQVDKAIAELELLCTEVGGGDHERRLEALYRRYDQPEKLAALLERRVLRDPGNAQLWQEAIALRLALGHEARARELEAHRSLALVNPAAFLAQLDTEERAGLELIRRRALSLAAGSEPSGHVVGEMLAQLRPFLHRPGFREVAEALLERFPKDPQAKPLRLELLDIDLDPLQSARAAERLASTYPEDLELLRVWIQRVEWADLIDDQVRARRMLLERLPDDRINREKLADLLEYRRDYRSALEHWRYLAADSDPESVAIPRLIDCLFAVGEDTEATTWLHRLATAPSASWQQKREAAEQLFYRKGYDQAQVLYRAVLEQRPDDALALLRLGQISSWSNDPRSAIRYLERRLEVSDEDRTQVLFQLGEAEWITGAHGDARQHHQEAVTAMLAVERPNVDLRSMTATMLSRLGRHGEARPLYRSLVAAAPRNVDLVLDFVDVLVADDDLREAELLTGHARTIDPDHPRLLRTDGALQGMLGRYRDADASLQRALDLHGPDAGIFAEQGRLREAQGDWSGALDAYDRWLSLQSESSAARRAGREVGDRLADFGVAVFDYRRVGDDRSLRAAVEGSAMLDADVTRLKVGLGYERYVGRAAAVSAGTTDVEEELLILDLALERRLERSDRWGAGVTLATGASGDLPLGFWAGLYLQSSQPYRTLELRAFGNEVWTDPAAAAGLGGRSWGLEAQGYSELSGALWGGARAQVASVELDVPGAGRPRDLRFTGELDLGYRLHEGDTAVADRHRIRRLPSGPASPFLDDDPQGTRDLMVNAWASLQSYHLVDDGELAGMVPIGRHSDYLLLAARADKHVARDLGIAVEGYAGVDLGAGSGIWGIDGVLTWRPDDRIEFAIKGGRGAALTRGGGDGYHLHLQAVVRW